MKNGLKVGFSVTIMEQNSDNINFVDWKFSFGILPGLWRRYMKKFYYLEMSYLSSASIYNKICVPQDMGFILNN